MQEEKNVYRLFEAVGNTMIMSMGGSLRDPLRKPVPFGYFGQTAEGKAFAEGSGADGGRKSGCGKSAGRREGGR